MDEPFPFQPAEDTSPAAWVVAGLQGFAESVLSIVPAGFGAYARIYHPAYRYEYDEHIPVRWTEIAEANGRVAHRRMQFPNLIGFNPHKQSASPLDIWYVEPSHGHLPGPLAALLWPILAEHTATPERCFFAVWEGWGNMAMERPPAPSFEIPGRRLLLYSASIEAAERSFSVDDPFVGQSANLWWPDDRAWCVATEIDFMTTYVGGSQAVIAAILEHPDLEAYRVEPKDGVQWASDTLNLKPRGDR